MASIYRGGGVWYLSYYVDGRRIRRRVGKSKRIAELARQEIEVKLAQAHQSSPKSLFILSRNTSKDGLKL